MEAVMQASFGQWIKIALKSKFAFKFGKLFIGNDLIGPVMPRSSVSSSLILAHWPGGPLCETPDWNVEKYIFSGGYFQPCKDWQQQHSWPLAGFCICALVQATPVEGHITEKCMLYLWNNILPFMQMELYTSTQNCKALCTHNIAIPVLRGC